jgi:hypothetical protein
MTASSTFSHPAQPTNQPPSQISTDTPPGSPWPGWLQTLATSEYVTEVEDWSK